MKEYRNYLWQTDKEGKIINEPEVVWNHSMDAIRYAINSMNVETEYKPAPLKNWTIA